MTGLMTLRRACAVALGLFAATPLSAQEQSTLREVHGDWEVRCTGGGTNCFMTQTYLNEQGAPVVVFSVKSAGGLTDNNGAPVAALGEVVVPFGVFLPGGLGLRVDSGEGRRAPYETCDGPGCRTILPVSDDTLRSLKLGGVAYVTVMRDPERAVDFPISLRGFTAAFDSL